MRYLGLDLGTRTLGLALSDKTHLIATSLKTIRFADSNYDELYSQIKDVIDEYEVSKVILGLPKNMNNSLGDRALTTMDFKEKLETFLNMEVILQDERLSTVEATNYMVNANVSRKKRKGKIDSVAASIILQAYLDKERGI